MKVLFTFLYFLFCVTFSIKAQHTESLLDSAKASAYTKKYDQAKETLITLLSSSPHHYDAQLLLAQVYAWKKEYELSVPLLSEIIQHHAPSAEAYEMLARVKLWQEAYPSCLEVCQTGLHLFPDHIPLQFIKAQALANQYQVDTALDLLHQIMAKDSSLREVQGLIEQLQYQKLKNAVTVEYSYARFTNTFSPWHTAAVSYRRNTQLGPVIGRVTHAFMFDQSGNQFEVDAYPKISKKSYGNLNIGTSDRHIFPLFRGGAEYFRLFPRQIELSGGFRYLHFDQAQVMIYTAQLGHYFNQYWVSARGYTAVIDNVYEMTGALTLRRYFDNPDRYLTFYVNTGSTPLHIVSLNEMRRLQASSFALDYQHSTFKRKLLLKAGAGYQKEFYEEIRETDRMTVSFSVEKRF